MPGPRTSSNQPFHRSGVLSIVLVALSPISTHRLRVGSHGLTKPIRAERLQEVVHSERIPDCPDVLVNFITRGGNPRVGAAIEKYGDRETSAIPLVEAVD